MNSSQPSAAVNPTAFDLATSAVEAVFRDPFDPWDADRAIASYEELLKEFVAVDDDLAFTPSPEESAEADALLGDASHQRLIRLARDVVAAGHQERFAGPDGSLDRAIGALDSWLRSMDDREREARIDHLNRDTAALPPGISENELAEMFGSSASQVCFE